MGSISKGFALFFILIMAISGLSLMMAKPAFAQTPTPSTIPKPSVPEFTVTLISSSPESHFVNKTIELSIKNQPSVSFYNVRMRVNDGNWSLLYLTIIVCQPSPMVNIQSYHTLQDFLVLNTNTI